VPGLRAAIARLMGDAALRDELGQRARHRVAELAWDRILEQHLELYGRVIAPTIHACATTPCADPQL